MDQWREKVQWRDLSLLQKTKTRMLFSLALLKKCHCLVRYTKMLALVYNGTSISIIELYKFKDIGTYFKYHCIHISIGILNVEECHVLSYIVCNIFPIPSIWFAALAKRHFTLIQALEDQLWVSKPLKDLNS